MKLYKKLIKLIYKYSYSLLIILITSQLLLDVKAD